MLFLTRSELTKKIEEETTKIAPITTDETHQRHLQDLDNNQFQAAKRCTKLEEQMTTVASKIQQVKAQIKALQEKKQHVQQETAVEVPKMKFDSSVYLSNTSRHALSLYGSISRIKWDYEADGIIKGCKFSALNLYSFLNTFPNSVGCTTIAGKIENLIAG